MDRLSIQRIGKKRGLCASFPRWAGRQVAGLDRRRVVLHVVEQRPGELFYVSLDNRIMVVDYTVNGASFASGKPRLWSEKQIYMPGNTNLTLAPDGKHFAVFPIPEGAAPEKGSVHVMFLLNFFDELRRRAPIGK
jgi:hypothetical protein